MTNFYKIQYIDMFDQEGKVITTVTTENGLDNMLDDPCYDVLAFKKVEGAEINECN